MFFVSGAVLVKYADQNEDRLFTKYLGQLLSLFALIPFIWFCVMIFITPLGIAESNSRDDAVDAVFRVLEKILMLNYFLQIKAIIMLFILKKESFVEH